MDIDLLARTSNQVENVRAIIKEVADIPVEEDGLIFNTDAIILRNAQAGAEYLGLSARFTAHLTKTRIPVQMDIGFSDIIIPRAKQLSYPSLIGMPAPKLMGYTIETVIAEKLESIVKLGQFNTRMKDFYDLWTLLSREEIPIKPLKQAIDEIFANRRTKREYPIAFTKAFFNDPSNIRRWRTFLAGLGRVEPELDVVIEKLSKNLSPYLERLSQIQ